jgi:hypothetical protein
MPDEQKGFEPVSPEHPAGRITPSPEGLAEGGPIFPEHEPVSAEAPGKYEKLLSTAKQAASVTGVSDDDTQTDLAHVKELEDEQQKIDHLVKLAQSKGLPHAVRVAERLKDYYALDMFHDTLVDNLYDALMEQGLITKE